MMEEKLAIANKPGLNVFDHDLSGRYFSQDTLVEGFLNTLEKRFIPEKLYHDSLMFYILYPMESNPETLFYLMSVCSEEDIMHVRLHFCVCEVPFTVTFENVVRVLLNWGATPESLRITNGNQLPSPFTTSLVNPSLNFPAPHNVRAVLEAIAECPPNETSGTAEEQTCDLIKVLLVASLDEAIRPYPEVYHAISTLLETSVYTLNKMVEFINLLQVGMHNASYICWTLINRSPHVLNFKIAVIRHMLHVKFSLPPMPTPFDKFLKALPPPENMEKRFSDVPFLIQLLNDLLHICMFRPENYAQACTALASVEQFLKWITLVRNEYKKPGCLHIVEYGIVRQKCDVLRFDISEVIRVLKMKQLYLEDEESE